MKIYNVSFLRALILPIIKWTAFDFSMKHPWSNNGKVRLNSFLYKGYWYHRKNREKRSMLLFSSLIKEGDTVVEVGGHIGFISTYFASLVGKNGFVFVFEPGSNNLPYIKKNLSFNNAGHLSNRVELIEAAVSDHDGMAMLYEDTLTGQNNSLVENFSGLKSNQANSFVDSEVKSLNVRTISLDNFFGNFYEGGSTSLR